MFQYSNESNREPSSFRDPAGFLFRVQGKLYRQVNQCYQSTYDHLMASGFYQTLTNRRLMVSHEEIFDIPAQSTECYKLLQPELVPFVSYPYEWCFDQLKQAALHTLQLQLMAMEQGLSLKDATPFNIQFRNGKPVLIDTLSWELYNENQPWVAYRQFCEMFLYPLLLEHYTKTAAILLLKHWFSGIPANYTAQLLPWKAKWNLGVRLHVLLQSGRKDSQDSNRSRPIRFSRQKMQHLISHLQSVVRSLQPGYPKQSEWNNYYASTILGQDYLKEKETIIAGLIKDRCWSGVLDLGANDGHFSKLLAPHAGLLVAADFDAACINRLFNNVRNDNLERLLPLVIDLSNPTPALGFGSVERSSFMDRAPSQLVLALALVHHLCIAKGIAMEQVAAFFAKLAEELLVEFVPREDEKVQLLLVSHSFDFPMYNRNHFEQCLLYYFEMKSVQEIGTTGRLLYWFKKRN
jgi:hypothetical protein